MRVVQAGRRQREITRIMLANEIKFQKGNQLPEFTNILL